MGGIDGKVVWLNLNPDYVDNNVILFGEVRNETFSGNWDVITIAGVVYTGTFTAVKVSTPAENQL